MQHWKSLRHHSVFLFCLVVVSSVNTGDSKTRLGGRTADDALEGSGVLVPEGTGGGGGLSCAIYAAVHKREDAVVNTHLNR